MRVKPCPHSSARWSREGNDLFRFCDDCLALLAEDTVAATFPANPALANQVDPDEERAWRQSNEH